VPRKQPSRHIALEKKKELLSQKLVVLVRNSPTSPRLALAKSPLSRHAFFSQRLAFSGGQSYPHALEGRSIGGEHPHQRVLARPKSPATPKKRASRTASSACPGDGPCAKDQQRHFQGALSRKAPRQDHRS